MPDTTTKEPEDLREKILFPIHEHRGEELERLYTHENVLKALDEYFTQRSMELLEYMAKNEVECYVNPIEGKSYFLYNKELYTKDQLFENFL